MDREKMEYGYYIPTETEEKAINKQSKFIPEVKSKLRDKSIKVPEAIYRCSGIKVLGQRLKSFVFTTDVAIIQNCNAQGILSVYPFTPQLSVMESILNVSSTPVFTGVGGGPTPMNRVINMAMQAELKGAHGVVLNAPTRNQVIREVAEHIDIAIVCTVASAEDDYMGKVAAGGNIINVSGGKDTAKTVKQIRKDLGPEFPIIATGGPNDESIYETIMAGANAITYTPPTTAEIFAEVMASYRKG